MKKSLALLLALVMLASVGLTVVPAAGPEAQTFYPSASPGTVESPAAVETGIPGMTLLVGADEWSCSEIDIPVTSAAGVDYRSFLTGKTNPTVDDGVGTYFSFTFDDSVKTGSLEITYRLNANKGFFILDNGEAMKGYDGMKLEVSADTSATIIVEGGHTYTVYAKGSKLRLYGCTFQNVDPKEVFAQEIAAFPFARIKGTNADADHVDEDLALMDSYESQFGSCDVNWTSSDASVVDVDGTVNCQKTDSKITLTGHFVVQEDRDFAADAVFTLTVLADPDDASAVAVATEALTLGDLTSVKRNLDLPAKGKRGTDIAWSTSNKDVVGADGKVYPAAEKDQEATLTATITRGSARRTKTFSVTVAGIVPVTLDSWVYAGKDGGLRFTPADGGSLKSVNVTCNDPNPGPDDAIQVVVRGADGAVKSSHQVSMQTAFDGVPVGKSAAVALEDVKLDAADTFELSAVNTKTGKEHIAPVKADDSLAAGATLYVVGDSTASVYGDDRYPRKGWAQMLGGYFDGVTVTDLALSGRASKSFKNEANYTTLKNALKKGDYLLIQFGHNDDKADAYADPAPSRFTDGSYKQSMLEYVELAWEKGAHPILATSISRRRLSDEGLEKYVAATRALAGELSVPCVDLYAATNGWINEVGVDGAMDMFNCVKPHDSRFLDYEPFAGSEFYESGSSDDTHLNLYGADLIAQWAADRIKALGLPLAAKVNSRKAVLPLPSYAEATEGPAQPPVAPEFVPADSFTDVQPGVWYYDDVMNACGKGLFAGTGGGKFSPDMVTTRAMIVTMLWRLEGQQEAEGTVAAHEMFSDIPEGSWFADAAAWANRLGIVMGYGNGRFGPDDPIDRQQLATILHRYAQAKGVDRAATPAIAYVDMDDVAIWAKDSVSWLTAVGVLKGKPGDRFDPAGKLTRAEAAVVMSRLFILLGR